MTSGSIPGLAFDSRGLLSGTPTSPDTYAFTLQVTDASAQTAARALSLTVNAASALEILTSVLPPAHVRFAYDEPFDARGGIEPYAWSLEGGSLPPGLTLTPAGRVQGTPDELGKFYFTVGVEDAAAAVAFRTVRIHVGRFGSNIWDPLGTFQTEVSSVAMDPANPNHVYASTSNINDTAQNAIFESVDGGESWRPISINNGLSGGGSLAVSPAESVLWARNSYRYEPVSKTWSSTNPPDYGSLDFDASDNAFLLGFDDRIYRLPTHGTTWEAVGTDCADELDLSICRLYPNYMYTPKCRSTDGGLTWSPMTAGVASYIGIRVSQTNPLDLVRIYGTSSVVAEHSADGGVTWTAQGIGTYAGAYPFMDRAVSDSAVVLFGAGSGGLFRSTDSGQTWTRVSSRWATSAAIDPLNTDKLYLGSTSGLFYSEDGGLTWAEKDRGLVRRAPSSLAISASAPSELLLTTTSGAAYLTRTSGERWTLAATGLSPFTQTKQPDISGADPNLYFISTGSGLYRSRNRGLTWTKVNPTVTFGSSGLAVGTDPFDANNLLYHSVAGFYRSTNGGDSWTPVSGASASDVSYAHVRPTPNSPTPVYAGSTGIYGHPTGIFRSDNGGVDWTKESSQSISVLEVAPSDPSRGYAAAGSTIYLRNPATGVWQLAPNTLPRPVYSLAVEWSDPLTAYAGVQHPGTAGATGGLYKTTDGGQTWARLAGVLDSFSVVAAVTHPTRPGTVFAASLEGGVFRSLDGGANWTLLPKYGTVADVVNLHVKQPGGTKQFAATEGYGIQVSNDGGLTFTPSVSGLGNLNVNALAFEPSSSTVLYAGTDAGVYKSTDAGGSWAPTNLTSGKVTDIVTDTEGTGRRIWCTVEGQGVAYSADDGATFTVYNNGLASLDLTSLDLENTGSGRRIWCTARGGDGVAFSDDNGATWKPAAGNGLTSRSLNDFKIQQGTGRRIWCTADEGVFYSENDGLSWTELSLGLPGGVPVTSISIDPHSSEALVSLFSDREGGVFRGANLRGIWSAFSEGLEELKVQHLTNDNGHVVSGSVNGTTFFAATAGDGVYQNEVQTTVAARPTITTAQLAEATLHSAHSQTLTATGGTPPYVWSVQDGALPPGLNLGATAGLISGDPSEVGTFGLTLQVADANQRTDSKAFVLSVVDPERPTVSIDDVVVQEGDSGSADAVFTVRLGAPSARTVTVAYATINGTASAGSDYTAVLGTLTFSPGATTGTVAVPILGDITDEPDETYTVRLSDPTEARIGDSQGVGTILDDDGTSQLSIDDVTVTEGNAGTTDAVFTVSLLPSSGSTVSVNYATANGTAGSTQSFSNTTFVSFPFLSGKATPYPSSVSVPALAGTVTRVTATLNGFSQSAPADADILLVGPGGQTVILMSDAGGTSSVSNLTLTFDDAAASTVPSSSPTSGTYRPTNVGAGDTFPTPAPAGPYGATLSVFAGATPAGTWSLYVADDTSGGSGSISGGWSLTVHTTGGDYTTSSGTLTFSPGSTTQTLAVPVLGDTLNELDETFLVDLSGATNATVADGQGVGTILNDDPAPTVSIGGATVAEGDAGTVNATFPVSFSASSGRTVTVNWATANGTASSGSDYTAGVGTLVFAPGTTMQPITVAVRGDTRDEDDETFFVNLIGSTAAVVVDGQGLGTIQDDDPLPSLWVGDATVTEGNSSSLNAVFVVALSPLSGRSVTVNYATGGGTATAGSDYTATSGTLTLAAGAAQVTIAVPVIGDLLDEPEGETFFVTLSGAVAATLADGEGLGTILDDDPKTLSIGDATIVEGNSGTADAVFTVTLSNPRVQPVTLDYSTRDGTTDNLRSFSNAAAISIPSGGAAAPYPSTISVPSLPGPVARVTATLSGFSHSYSPDVDVLLVGPGGQSVILMSDVGFSASGAILTFDDSAATSLPSSGTLVSGTYRPTNAGAGDAFQAPAPAGPYGATLSAFAGLDPAGTWSLYVLDDSTAFSGSISGGWSLTFDAAVDFTPTSGTITFTPGTTTQTVVVPVLGDTIEEDNETFFVDLSNPTNATIADSRGTGLIMDDDGAPRLMIDDVTVPEGAGNAILTISLAAGGSQTAIADFQTADGTSIAGTDYASSSGTVTFLPGDFVKTIAIAVTADNARETGETFFVNLSNPTNAVITDVQGVVTITDDDPVPALSIGDVTATEGDAGTTSAVFPVSLSHPSFEPVTVRYATADGTAISGASTSPAPITIPGSGAATPYPASIAVPALPGPVIKVTATLNGFGHTFPADVDVLLVGPTGQSVLLISDVGGSFDVTGLTLTFDDAAPSGLPSSSILTSGTYKPTNFGTGDTFPGPAPTGPYGAALSVFNGLDPAGTWSLYVVDDVAGDSGAIAGGWTLTLYVANLGDYTPSSGTLTFLPGVTMQTLSVPVKGDTVSEADETFFVDLSNPTNATIADGRGQCTILDDDALMPSLSIDDVTVTEGNAGTVNAVFTISLLPAAGSTVSVDYATADGGATASADYVATSGTLTFLAGVTSQTVSVAVNGDTLDEADETFFVGLSGATNAAITDAQGQGTIVDDDSPSLSISDVAVAEGDAGTTPARFTVSLSQSSTQTVTVQYATANGTATASSDYMASSGTLTFAPGDTAGTVTVSVVGDTSPEADESLAVNLSSPTNATIADGQGVGTILNDDAPGAIQFGSPTYTVGEAGVNAIIGVTRTGGTAGGATVQYATSDGTASTGTDYTARSGTLSFGLGVTSVNVTIPITNDTLDESDETVDLVLSNPGGGATLGAPGTAVLTVLDDDAPGTGALQFTVERYTVGEASPAVTITAKRTGGTAGSITVGYATSDGTATAGLDYTTRGQTLTFGPGVTAQSFSVPILPDTLIEGNETVLLRLRGPGGGATLGYPSTAVLTITDNEAGGAFKFGAATYSRAESYPSATITVVRTGGTGGPVTVDFATSDGSATVADGDYAATSGTLTFLAGQTSRTFMVPITNDALDEANETVSLTLSNPTGGATLGAPIASLLTITDNDVPGAVQLGATSYATTEGAGTAAITVTRSGGAASGVTVAYATSDGSALAADGDYSATSGTLTFGAGSTLLVFTVPITDDSTANEGVETVNLTLGTPTGGATLGARTTAILAINDNEPGDVVFFSNPLYSVSEAVSSAVVAVKRSGSTSSPMTVSYTTSDGSAVAGQDYTTKSGTLSFGAGISALTLSVPITPDTLDENDETVDLALSSPSMGVLGTQASAVLTIVDNDTPGAVRFSRLNYAVSEASATATITVSRTGGAASGVTVQFAMSDGTATSLGPNPDYTATSGTLTFLAGQTSRSFTIPITPDTLDESSETVNLSLSSPGGGATLGAPVNSTLTITDNDSGGAVQFSLSSYTVSEGGLATVTVTRSGGTASGVTVDFATTDGTATLADGDYVATSGTLSFGAGDSSEAFTVQTGPDALDEGNETINLALTNPTGGATLGARTASSLTITDSPAATLVYFGSPNISVVEGSLATVTVMRSGPLSGTSSVVYQTSNGTAAAGSDYTAKSGMLSFGVGVSKLTFTVATKSDTVVEGPETVGLTLSSPTGATLGTQGTSQVTIMDNDLGGVIQFSLGSYSRSEIYATATITVTRTGGAASSVTVDFATSDGTATAGQDYTGTSGTLTFLAGQASNTFTVSILNDTLDETNETVTLTLSNPLGGASLGAPNQATLTITDNDTAGTVQFSGASYSVGEGGVTATITMSRTGGAASEVAVSYATSDGTATDGSDYTATSGTLTFAAGQTTQTFTVTILQDASVEGNETVNLALSAPGGGAVLGPRSTAALFIVDDE